MLCKDTFQPPCKIVDESNWILELVQTVGQDTDTTHTTVNESDDDDGLMHGGVIIKLEGPSVVGIPP